MKTPKISLLLCLLSFCALALGTSRVLADQPLMNRAIEQLEMARKGEHIEHLEKAKHALEEAAHDKGGERAEAIHHIDEAIAAAKHDEHKRMEGHIDEAIAAVRAGKRDAR
jgi:hypothetical protein